MGASGSTTRGSQRCEADVPTDEENRRRSHGHILIPEDILFRHILPRLPIKSWVQFQLVSRSWHSSIAGNRCFLLDHARHASSNSSGFVYQNSRGKIGVLSCGEAPLIDVPDPSLGFCGHFFRLDSSAHGLLCLRVFSRLKTYVYVCNPLTGDGERIALPSIHEDQFSSVGLAFDPSSSPDCYTLVRLIQQHYPHESLFQYTFETFSSRVGQWTSSTQKVDVEGDYSLLPGKAVLAGRFLYWHLGPCMIAFNPDEDVAEVVKLPEPAANKNRLEIGVWDDRLTCTYASGDFAQVWVMWKKNMWEMRWQVSLKRVVKFVDYHWKSINLKTPWKLFKPMPYEGGSGLYLRMEASQPKETMLRCDLQTDEVKIVGEDSAYWWLPFFSYYNSYMPVPKTSTRVEHGATR